MGLGRTTNGPIIHLGLLEYFWSTFVSRTNHEQTQTKKIHHGPNSGEATTFPILVYVVHGHGTNTQISFCLETFKLES
jgi:hypothetical protein